MVLGATELLASFGAALVLLVPGLASQCAPNNGLYSASQGGTCSAVHTELLLFADLTEAEGQLLLVSPDLAYLGCQRLFAHNGDRRNSPHLQQPSGFDQTRLGSREWDRKARVTCVRVMPGLGHRQQIREGPRRSLDRLKGLPLAGLYKEPLPSRALPS